MLFRSIEAQTSRHYATSKDVYWAFNKLLNEQEEPALIMADLIRMKDEKDAEKKSE